MDQSDIVTIIPIRDGSRGLPNKNISILNGSPLYLHTVKQAKCFSEKVIISTNIDEVLSADLPSFVNVHKRPEYLSSDTATMSDVISYLIDELDLIKKNILLLQATSPLRSSEDISNSIQLFDTGGYDMVFTVSKKESKVLKYGFMDEGVYSPLSSDEFLFLNRQELPPVFGHNGSVYIFSAQSFVSCGGFPTKNIGAVIMPAERSLDIDDQESFLKAVKYFNK